MRLVLENKERKMNNKIEYEIGIGVTEYNRPEVFEEFLKNIKKYMPPKAKLVIVDDHSDIPVKEATYRFEENAGIARAKNKCLELLQDCKHIFLFDSDCWPRDKNWYKPYVNGPEKHYCYIFENFVNGGLNDCQLMYHDSTLNAYTHARGCMLYLDRRILEVVGGMDTRYRRWGYEHVDLSNRIYNNCLTRFRYQDVPESNKYIYSSDEYQEVPSTVSMDERLPYLAEMKDHFEKSYESKEYCSFVDVQQTNGKDTAVIACYLTSGMDLQRNKVWQPDFTQLNALINSMNGQKLVILHDCFGDEKVPDNVELVRVESSVNPYRQRWINEYDYLMKHPNIKAAFLVDSTDVEMLRNPFNEIQVGKLYSGNEIIPLYNNWMIANHNSGMMIQFFKRWSRYGLLNCGIVGGDYRTLMEFLKEMNDMQVRFNDFIGPLDMGVYNYVCREKFNDKLVVGDQVNTRFKAYEINNQTAWFKHK